MDQLTNPSLSNHREHFEAMLPKVKSGDWKLGGNKKPNQPTSEIHSRKIFRVRELTILYPSKPGALLKDVPKDDEVSSLDFWGSTLVINAESKEKVIEMLKNDAYGKANVWDWEKVRLARVHKDHDFKQYEITPTPVGVPH